MKYDAHLFRRQSVDVINLETGTFETLDFEALVRKFGDEYPGIRQIVSIVEEKRIRKPTGLEPDFDEDDMVITFEGLITDTVFVERLEQEEAAGLLDDYRTRLKRYTYLI